MGASQHIIREVKVELKERAYPIYIGPHALRQLSGGIERLDGVRRILIIADRHVAELHLDAVRQNLSIAPEIATFLPGEASKSLAEFGRLTDAAAAAQLQRGDLIITLGGGVAGDLGGFVAATWMRGIRFIQIATTIEAAVDASVGGKTAVNHPRGKNLIGAFHQPSAVIIDTELLATLDPRDFRAGLAESVKHAVTRDPDFLGWHTQHVAKILDREHDAVSELIARNCAIKAEVVAQDEREHGLRAILNYGHTIGHAIELLMGYELRHGECVALGILAENELASRRRMLAAGDAERIAAALHALGLPVRLPRAISLDDALSACRMDKKNRAGRVAFMLLRGLGAAERVDDLADDEIRAAFGAIRVGASE